MLEPSNFTEAVAASQPAEYGRWRYEEAASDSAYGDMFTKFMAQHPAGRKRQVRDLD